MSCGTVRSGVESPDGDGENRRVGGGERHAVVGRRGFRQERRQRQDDLSQAVRPGAPLHGRLGVHEPRRRHRQGISVDQSSDGEAIFRPPACDEEGIVEARSCDRQGISGAGPCACHCTVGGGPTAKAARQRERCPHERQTIRRICDDRKLVIGHRQRSDDHRGETAVTQSQSNTTHAQTEG